MITIKNRTNKELFNDIGIPPSVIVTRWSSWLRAALYYADNLPGIRKIVNSISDKGILLTRAKEAANQSNLTYNLLMIKECYEQLIPITENFENSKYTIYSGYETLSQIEFKSDPVNVKKYIVKRLADNDITVIVKLTNPNISPSMYQLLRECPPTSISVERSFSMLKKLIATDRNFNEVNLFHYIFCYFNSKVNDIETSVADDVVADDENCMDLENQ